MKKVLIIVGHQNIENLTKDGLRDWRSVELLKRSTGASGERDYFNNKVTPLLKSLLEKGGVDVTVTDAIYHEDVYSQDYDLCIAMHYDGGGTGNRCMAESPNVDAAPPYINSKAMDKADKFISAWSKTYPEDTKVTLRQDLITEAMYDYYCWDYVSENTPSVIIEHFNHTSPRGVELKEEPELIAKADARAILNFFGMGMPEECVPLNEDISTDVEDRYDLKTFEWYNKYWTMDEFIKDSVRTHKELTDTLKTLEEKTTKLKWTEEQLQKSVLDEAKLRSDLEESRKHASKLSGDILFRDKKIETLEEELKLSREHSGVLQGIIEKLNGEITELKDKNLILSNQSNSLLVEMDRLIEKKFTDWLSEQNFKTRMKYLFRILRNK